MGSYYGVAILQYRQSPKEHDIVVTVIIMTFIIVSLPVLFQAT